MTDGSTFFLSHMHTNMGARITHGLFSVFERTGLDRDGGETSSQRCDAMPMKEYAGQHGTCILRCAFWNRNRLSTCFSLSLLVCFSPLLPVSIVFLDSSKKSENKHHMHHSSSYRKGEDWSKTCAYLVIWISGTSLSLSREPVSLFQPCCCLPTIPNPLFFLASRPPPTRSQTPGYPPPSISSPSCQTCHRRRRDEAGRNEEFSSEWLGGYGGRGLKKRRFCRITSFLLLG